MNADGLQVSTLELNVTGAGTGTVLVGLKAVTVIKSWLPRNVDFQV